MLSNFLTNVWKEGALCGAKAADAFNVEIGLGTTMTAEDILNGYLRVSIFLAVSHPAEFIVVTVEQELAKS
jgi:phage tail sheath protein FI